MHRPGDALLHFKVNVWLFDYPLGHETASPAHSNYRGASSSGQGAYADLVYCQTKAGGTLFNTPPTHCPASPASAATAFGTGEALK